ncbi:response regulator transcription factor [Georgenia sp. SYP-B2076]|uniref:response regulator transcription factor n=1 Tax=Georgenia sp. SYP-B2076 TaxID=2495881 RepID=UPI000F8F3A86|nr:response regulator transcription factor [Georgenia sp. SYP-B2076]
MKVLIADDNAIVRLGVRAVLERIADVAEVYEAADGQAAIDVVRARRPDVVLLDVRMPRKSGLEVLDEIAPETCTLVLTHSEDPEIIRQALAAGARGYLVHGRVGVDELSGALQTCRSGGLVLGPEAAAVLSGGAPAPAPEHPLRALLTAREADVVEAAAQGLSNDEIARTQFLSPRTVKNYLNSAYPKLGVHDRAAAVVAWLAAAHDGAAPGAAQGALVGR